MRRRCPVQPRPAVRVRGFNLVELLTVLAVGAVVLAMALPDMRALIREHRLRAIVNDLTGAIDQTRAQALARGARVLLAPAAGGADWRKGWAVFVDLDGDLAPGAADEIIARRGPPPSDVAIAAAFTGQQGVHYLAYNGAGRSCSAGSSVAARWGMLTVSQGDQVRHIKINMLGRARLCDPAVDGAGCSGAEED